MPPKKRALEQSDANVQPARDPKQQKRVESANDVESETEQPAGHSTESGLDKELEKKKPEEYICVDQPFWDRPKGSRTGNGEDEDSEDSDEDEDEDEDEIAESQSSSTKMWPKPASEHPEWKWTMMWKSWELLCDFSIRAKYTEPEYFDMYIYNDWHGYGMLELAENAINDFHKEWSKKDGSLHLMWAHIAMLGYWLCLGENLLDMTMVDDGERANAFISLIGLAVLTALHAIDRAGKLTKDLEFRDLGLVMALYLNSSYGLEKYGLQEDEEVPWREHIVGYAKKAGIDLRTVGCASMDEALEDIEDAASMDKSTKVDRWSFKKTFKEYAGRSGKIGGQKYDITKMSSRERAAYAFDKVDPLKDVPKKVLKENRLDFGP